MARHLLVTNDFPPKTGGIQVYLHELWRRLESGRATVLTASSDPGAEEFDHSSDLVIERVPARTLFAPTPRALSAIEAAIERHHPSLVLFDPAWPLGLLGPHLSVPYGVVLHGAEVTIPGRLPFVASTLRRVLRHAAVVVSAGGYPEAEARRVAAEWMPPVVSVPPGVDTERFRPGTVQERVATRAALDVSPEAFLVSSFSRLVPRKGMDTLIDAAAILAPSWPELLVTIGGSGRDRERLERRARRSGAPVRFLGRVADDRLAPWLATSDLFVMDCRNRWAGLEQEGFGIVFLEAAACGVPSIAGRSGGSAEAVVDGETGLVLHRPRSARALARALVTLRDDPVRRASMGEAARDLTRRDFDWDVLARRLATGLEPYDAAPSPAPTTP